jgi:hypothetical protein
MEITQNNLSEMIQQIRINANFKVILKKEDQDIKEIMIEESREAEVVIMGLMEPQPGEEEKYAKRLLNLVDGLPTVILVKNSSYFKGKLV